MADTENNTETEAEPKPEPAAKAKSSLLQVGGMPDFDPSRVKVVTERGVVYLMGLINEQEGDAVTSTVRRVNGVQRVVKLFEYI